MTELSRPVTVQEAGVIAEPVAGGVGVDDLIVVGDEVELTPTSSS